MKNLIKKYSRANLLIVFVLIAAMALTMTACGKTEAPATGATIVSEGGDIGEGSKAFTFEVVDSKGETTTFNVKTDAETVGEALENEQLIAGEMGDYGLYVKTVNGETADYDKDGHYWGFYVNGEYGMTGVDQTPVDTSATYTFKYE